MTGLRVSGRWLAAASALWIALAIAGVWVFAPIYMWVCSDCGIPPPGGSYGPGEQHIVWEPTVVSAAVVATVVTLGATGLALVRRQIVRGRSGR
jgi:hypothetical protein